MYICINIIRIDSCMTCLDSYDMSGFVWVWFDVNPFPIYVVHSKTFEVRQTKEQCIS